MVNMSLHGGATWESVLSSQVRYIRAAMLPLADLHGQITLGVSVDTARLIVRVLDEVLEYLEVPYYGET